VELNRVTIAKVLKVWQQIDGEDIV